MRPSIYKFGERIEDVNTGIPQAYLMCDDVFVSNERVFLAGVDEQVLELSKK